MESFAERVRTKSYLQILTKYGQMGVDALKQATPREEGETAEGWYYEIVDKPGYFSIHWLNSHIVGSYKVPVAVLIQYGHGTRQGGYVEGRDFINPAMRPIFDQIASDAWKEVTRP
jgi:hypothetical protein